MPEASLALEPLRVSRTSGAESCPDAVELGERVEAIRGQPAAAGAAYEVRFDYDGQVFSAELRASVGPSVRTLESPAADCEALARATAVTLALLFDATPAPAASEPATEEPPPMAAATASPTVAAAFVTPQRSEPARLGLGIGAGVGSGILRPWSEVMSAELGLRVSALRFGVGVQWIPKQRLTLGPGSIELELIAVHTRACWAAFRTPWLQVESCAGVALGSIAARPNGFPGAESRVRTFAGLPLELAVGQAADHVSWELSAALLFVFRRTQFEIEGAGTAYDAPWLAAMFSLRAAGWLEL
jgi:hypothetical protein